MDLVFHILNSYGFNFVCEKLGWVQPYMIEAVPKGKSSLSTFPFPDPLAYRGASILCLYKLC